MKSAKKMQLPIINLHKMKKTATIILLLLSTVTFAQTKEEKVWSRVDALTKAVFEAKDSIALNDLVSTHVTYGHSTGLIEDKATMVHNAATSATKYKNLSAERVSIDIDDNTAVLRQILRAISVDDKGVETPLNLGILQVWKKEHGKWRIWGRQAVKIAPKS